LGKSTTSGFTKSQRIAFIQTLILTAIPATKAFKKSMRNLRSLKSALRKIHSAKKTRSETKEYPAKGFLLNTFSRLLKSLKSSVSGTEIDEKDLGFGSI